ncbi:ATP-dependent helicase HrpB [Hymenobacter taeanensis]|uniref:ATP-dependent helicase HrpB n=1 Tax=Hymenobacter taeanensis TaxID=2735321 RepID=A0A6M6BDJ3_9BACT|nr:MULTISPECIES: ATP-dependent helicase HrpB [Hymenobacter]QJX46042.1 ATP-dependent helicase HrpB [Hymenobacter taeanensis]UOQ79896.1 ATP-dependent helicase HrpB [Hymenobacter sp. 5414T-23]
MLLPDLPIRDALPELLQTLAAFTIAVLQAPPGAGKTTVVPLALLDAPWREGGRILVLEPRRLAARAAAIRMAQLLGEPVGQTVGYRMRLESKVSAQTRIEVVTEVILTRQLQDDPALEGVAAVLFDEFHERSLQADLGLALALDAQSVLRPDLRLLVMSATLDADRLGAWLGAPVVRSLGRMFPVETHYLSPARAATASRRPHEKLQDLTPVIIREALAEHATGDVLVFLPGLADQRRVADKLASLPDTIDIHVLHGELPAEQQDAALRPAANGRRKIVLATSIAETSLTIEGVTIVVDGGYARVPRFEPRTGLTTLGTEPVSQAAADQRRGRAGRLGPGTCYRLWTAHDYEQLPHHLAPEILTADLSALALELALWGARDASALRWLDAPPAPALAQARELLVRLQALTPDCHPTAHGRLLAGLGLAPRLAHLVVRGKETGHGATACALAALLTERDILRPADGSFGPPDLRLRLEALVTGRAPLPGLQPDAGAVRRVREAAAVLRNRAGVRGEIEPDVAGLLAALAYPDRLGQRETPERVRLVTGQRATLPAEYFSSQDAYFAVAALDGTAAQPRAGLAAPLSKAELEEHFATQIETLEEVRWDEATGRVVARRLRRLGALVLSEANLPNPSSEAISAALLGALRTAGISRLPWSEAATQVRERLAFLQHLAPDNWPSVSDEQLLDELEDWLGPYLTNVKSMAELSRVDLAEALLNRLPGGWAQRQELDKLAPSHLEVPTGSHIRLDYSEPAAPVLAVRLQEVFGLLDTPMVGGGRVPLTLHLLSPGYRPAQVTRDLRSFWTSSYFEVRKELRGRYPKHYWPENPLEAQAIRGTKKQNGL